MEKEKLVIICSGSDWSDASFDDVIIPPGMNLEEEKSSWRKWYEEEYLPQLHGGNKPNYKTFVGFICEKGARKAETEQFWED